MLKAGAEVGRRLTIGVDVPGQRFCRLFGNEEEVMTPGGTSTGTARKGQTLGETAEVNRRQKHHQQRNGDVAVAKEGMSVT